MSADLDTLSREIAATSNAVRLAIAAVKANPRHELYPLPWGRRGIALVSGDGYIVGGDLLHIAAAVNAAPVLIAEVERLQSALEAARVAAEKLRTNCRDDCASVQPFLPGRDCDCGAEIAIELCRALHRG